MKKVLRSIIAVMLFMASALPSQAQSTFRELLNGQSASDGTIVMPSNAQVLKMYNDYLLLWDGTAGILFYVTGIDQKLTNLEYSTPYYDGYTGYTISGSIEASYEDDYYDFYSSASNTGSLTFGTKQDLTPIVATGAEAANTDRSRLYCYVQMHGTIENSTFTADDGTQFTVNEDYNTGVIGKQGAGTIKAVVGRLQNSESLDVLTIIENKAWTSDAAGQDFQAEVMTLAQVKEKNYETVRFKFEEDKVQVAVAKSSYGFDYLYLWDGNDGLLVNGYIGTGIGGDVDFEQGQVLNGGVEATYMGSYGNSMYFNPDYGNEIMLTKGSVNNLIPKKKTLAEIHATANTSTYEFSYLAVDGTIENGALKQGDISIPLSNDVLPAADLSKYEGQTGTFYGLYQSRSGEFLMPISEYYFVKADDPIDDAIEIETIDDLWKGNADEAYVMKLAAENDYQVQILAVEEAVIYLWDGKDGIAVFDDNLNFQYNDAGKFIYGDIKFNVKAVGDENEAYIDFASIQQMSAPVDPLPAVEKTNLRYGDYIKMHGTIESDKDNAEEAYQFIMVGDKKYWIFDNLLDPDTELFEYTGKTGTITAIYTGGFDGEYYLSLWDENWFEEDKPNLPEVTTLAELKASSIGDYLLTIPANGNYKLQVLAVKGSSIYLYDGTEVIRVEDKNEVLAPRKAMKKISADKVGAYISGNIVVNLTSAAYLIDPSTITFSAVEPLMEAQEKSVAIGFFDYVKVESTVEKQTGGSIETLYMTNIDGNYYVLSSDLIGGEDVFAQYVGKQGTMTLIIDGAAAYAYPEQWFVDPSAISSVSTDESTVIYDLNGRRMNERTNLQKGIYIVNGKKVVK